MHFWLDIAAFALKALLIVAAVGGVVFLITRLTRGEAEEDSEIKVDSLNERYDARQARLNGGILSKKERKALAKQRKAVAKASKKAAKSPQRRRRPNASMSWASRATSAPARLGGWGGRSTLC